MGYSLNLKGKVYTSCVRGCSIYSTSSETWPMKAEHKVKLDRNEMRMIRWLCGFQMNNLIKRVINCSSNSSIRVQLAQWQQNKHTSGP